MIINSLLDVLFALVDFILAPINLLNWTFNLDNLSLLRDFLKVVYFVIPFDKISPIISFVIAMFFFRAIVSLIKTIWDLLPIV